MPSPAAPTRTLYLPLTEAQLRYRRSESPYRGFVGGRGAGKTHVGALDVLFRAQPGRTYLIASPTGVLMQDTTFPTIKELVRRLGLRHSVKLTPYPNIELGNGAVIRLRTAEDPERLRGPNLSGVWLDEASLMSLEAFNVAIACLREGESQGWLGATFTPKGLSHWTYEVFGQQRPNTEIVYSPTADNPFLPPDFAATLATQYSPQRQRQELEGQFVSMEGAEWLAEYFPDSIMVPLAEWPTHWKCAALALDPAMGEKEHGKPPPSNRPPEPGCYAAFAFVGVAQDNTIWVDAWMSQSWDAATLARLALELMAHTRAGAFVFETNGGQQFLTPLFMAEARRLNRVIPLWGINNLEDKEIRIRDKITPFLAQGRMRFNKDSPGAKMLVGQLRDFPVGKFRDGPDALQMALVMADWLAGHKPGGAQPRAMR